MADDHQVLREHLRAAYRYAYALTHHHQNAEDLVQQASIKLIKRYGHISKRSTLFVTIRNLYVDLHCRKAVASTTIDDLGLIEDEHSDVELLVDARLDLGPLLAKLNPEEREVLHLQCVEGYSAKEIGAILGKPRGTVLSMLARTKKKLAEMHRPSHPNDEPREESEHGG